MIKVKIDSRLIEPGDTFVAIKGEHTDGHNYIEKAIEKGAKCIVCENDQKYSVKTINVPDSKEYLKDYLSKKYRNKLSKLKLVGITGTNGKTTTAYMTYQLLRSLKIKCAYIGTIGFFYNDKFNSTLNTTPDVLNLYNCLLIALKNKCEIVILEASSIGLFEERLFGLWFDIAVFTNLTHDHLDYHLNMNNYMNAKMLLFDSLKYDGTAIVNIDDKYGIHFLREKCLTYGFGSADIRCIKHSSSYQEFTYAFEDKEYKISSPLFGKYNVYNLMASLCILSCLGIDLEKANHNFTYLKPPDGRLNIIDYKTNKIIIDYAHTPDGLKQVISSARNLTSGKTYVVFGCPGNRDKAKRPMMAKVVNRYADYFIVTDDDPHDEDEMAIINDTIKGLKSDKYEVIVDRKKAISKAFKLLKENDTLLVLGKGHEDYIILKDKKIPHNDSKYIQELINKK